MENDICWLADVKANIKQQERKDLVAVSYKFLFGRVFFILILVGIPKPSLIQALFHIGDCFWVHNKIDTQKVKHFFQHNLYSWKAHAHYVTVLIYLETWRAAKLVFILILHPYAYTDVAKASQLTNVCILIC